MKNWKWPLVCSNPNISTSTWPKLKIKDSFEILRTSRFQNWPSFLNLVNILWRYWQKTNLELFVDTVYLIVLVLLLVMRKYDGFWPVLHKNKLDHFVLSWEKEAEIEWASNRRSIVSKYIWIIDNCHCSLLDPLLLLRWSWINIKLFVI